MNHVFVETNFFIDALRPTPKPGALALRNRVGSDVQLYVPWVAIAEAKRTLVHIVHEDLDFSDMMERFAVREFLARRLPLTDKTVIDRFAKLAAAAHAVAVQNVGADVDALAAQATIIEPTRPVIAKTLQIFPVKSLKPFDEMVLGAVLVGASDLKAAGHRDIFFCNLNTKDFDPANRPDLAKEYAAAGITFKPSFAVP